MRIVPHQCIRVEEVYFLQDSDLDDWDDWYEVDHLLDQTQVRNVPEWLECLVQSVQDKNWMAVEAWSELAIKQGCKPSGTYRLVAI